MGGVLWALLYVGAPSSAEYDAYQTYNRLMPVVLVLLLLGLAGAHALQRRTYGWLGTVGFAVASVGLVAMIVSNVAEFWAFTKEAYGIGSLRDTAWAVFGLGMFVFYVGLVLFGIATLRAKMLPRLGSLLLMVWVPVGFVIGGLLQLVGVPENLSFSGLTGLCGMGWIGPGLRALLGRGRASPARRVC